MVALPGWRPGRGGGGGGSGEGAERPQGQGLGAIKKLATCRQQGGAEQLLEVIDTLVDLLRYEGTYTQVQAQTPEDSTPAATLHRTICDSGG